MTHSFDNHIRRANGSAERTLEKLWVDFVKLQRIRTEVLSDFGVGDTKDVSQELADDILTPIACEMRQLASRAAKVGSTCHDDIEYKAVMLAEFLPDEDCAIQTVLAGSLVSDIRRGACLTAG